MMIEPYKKASKSFKSLTEFIKTRKLLKPVCINWGNSDIKAIKPGVKYINDPRAVSNAIDKIKAFTLFKQGNVSTPRWTTDKDTAQLWLDEGEIVVCRQSVKANSGKGIVIASKEDGVDGLPSASLYTLYLRKKSEYRVHVFNGKVIDYTEKKAKKDKPVNYNKYIRSHSCGWIYCRDGVERNEEVCKQAILAVKSLGLDFGAVDVCLYKGKPYVLEVNTAPGIEGLTLMQYVVALEEMGIISCR